jgi:hypothetical protein
MEVAGRDARQVGASDPAEEDRAIEELEAVDGGPTPRIGCKAAGAP